MCFYSCFLFNSIPNNWLLLNAPDFLIATLSCASSSIFEDIAVCLLLPWNLKPCSLLPGCFDLRCTACSVMAFISSSVRLAGRHDRQPNVCQVPTHQSLLIRLVATAGDRSDTIITSHSLLARKCDHSLKSHISHSLLLVAWHYRTKGERTKPTGRCYTVLIKKNWYQTNNRLQSK